MNYVIGQRWISHTEPQLGLGIVAEFAGRRVTISFPAIAEQRIYAGDNAPLSRVTYKQGDTVSTHDDIELTITAIEELRGILIYTGTRRARAWSAPLPNWTSIASYNSPAPRQRLLSGQLDKDAGYQLRMATLIQRDQLQGSGARGLLGTRTSLLPHQIYIASEVARRYAPRVLLADEVGLGKTIEAGMILHQQLLTARARRVLIVVPPTLLHQWLVEMLRRFNLRFALFDQERYQALKQLEQEDRNPFHSEQLVLCSLDFSATTSPSSNKLQAADWDLLVVDEAHHLHWSEQQSVSTEYQCIENAGRPSEGLVATDSNPGAAGHRQPLSPACACSTPRASTGCRNLNRRKLAINSSINWCRNCLAATSDITGLPWCNDCATTSATRPIDAQGKNRDMTSRCCGNCWIVTAPGGYYSAIRRAAIGGFPERQLANPTRCPAPKSIKARALHFGTGGLYPGMGLR